MGFKNHRKHRDKNHKALACHAASLEFLELDTSSVAGCVDAIWIRNGHVFFVEIKNPETRGKLAPHQVALKNQIEQYGGLHATVETEKDVNELFKRTL